MNQEHAGCGSIGHMSPPECERVSWEFCLVGAGSLGLVVLYVIFQSFVVVCKLSKNAKQRRMAREQRELSGTEAQAAATASHEGRGEVGP